MYVRRNLRWQIILRFAWLNIIVFAIWGSLIVWAYHFFVHISLDISIPFLPISMIGIAVSFYIGFKNNQAYDRFWEGRKIWGGIVNYSRTWGNQVLHFITMKHAHEEISIEELHKIRKKLIYRHIAWINALRLQLRRPGSFSIKFNRTVKSYHAGDPEKKHWEEDVAPFLCNEEIEHLMTQQNVATQLIKLQGRDLRCLVEDRGLSDDFRHMEMMRVLEEFYNFQGKCERINNTPFPRQFAYFSKVFTWIFIFLLPFGLIGEFAQMGHSLIWLTVPFYVLIAWIFITMELVGDNSEDPFQNFVNDVPMTALCRTIEIDLREMLDETELPPKVQAVNDILM